jgi:hypothetical protein
MGAKRARRVAWAVGIGAALGAYGLVACEGDDTNPARPNPNSSSSGGTDATTSEGGDQDTGTVDPALCSRYGGFTGVQQITADILTAVKADCRISAEFAAPQSGISHVQQCLEKQMGTFFGCPGIVYDKDTAGKTCRSMAEAHKGLGLRQADFTAFISDTNGVLKAHSLSDSDRTAILAAINGTQASIVQKGGLGNSNCSCANLTLPDGGYCGIPDAGIDTGVDGGDGGDSGDNDSGTLADAADDGG